MHKNDGNCESTKTEPGDSKNDRMIFEPVFLLSFKFFFFLCVCVSDSTKVHNNTKNKNTQTNLSGTTQRINMRANLAKM